MNTKPKRKPRNSLCIVPGCKKNRYSRGLCKSCGPVVYRLIRKKKYTDEDLVKRKKILPKRGRGGRTVAERVVNWIES